MSIELNPDWFDGKMSMEAFQLAMDMAKEVQCKLDSSKGAIVMYDDEVLTNVSCEYYLDGLSSSVHLKMVDKERKNAYTYSLCGCTSDGVTGKIYSRKSEVREAFKRISFYKKF